MDPTLAHAPAESARVRAHAPPSPRPHLLMRYLNGVTAVTALCVARLLKSKCFCVIVNAPQARFFSASCVVHATRNTMHARCRRALFSVAHWLIMRAWPQIGWYGCRYSALGCTFTQSRVFVRCLMRRRRDFLVLDVHATTIARL